MQIGFYYMVALAEDMCFMHYIFCIGACEQIPLPSFEYPIRFWWTIFSFGYFFEDQSH